MPSLYNCRHDGDQYRITKFDTDFNVEASYLCDLVACECPAGHRPKCRHREMLPKFIARGHIGDEWFFDHDRGGWVQGAGKDLEDNLSKSNEQLIAEAEPLSLASAALPDQPKLEPSLTVATEIALPADATSNEVAEAFGNLLAPERLGQAGEPYGIGPAITNDLPILIQHNEQQRLHIQEREIRLREPSPSPLLPTATIRRRV